MFMIHNIYCRIMKNCSPKYHYLVVYIYMSTPCCENGRVLLEFCKLSNFDLLMSFTFYVKCY